tara:strand:- start:152 stop:1006 length:855 start_codon:yes stop_codon:yes gene_type:complete
MAFNEQRNKNKAKIWTVIVHILLMLWFAFYGLTYQDPPPEEGIAINFGYEETGAGENTQAAPTIPPPTPTTPVETTPVQEEVVTQDVEDAPVIESTDDPTPTQQEEIVEQPKEETEEPIETVQEPEPDPQPTAEELERNNKINNLENRLTKTNPKGGDGKTESGGDQGDQDGDLLSPNRTGNGGTGGNGKYWMSGTPITLPEPETGCNYEGVVVIKIAVTEAGSVYEAELAPNNQIPDSLPKSNFGSNTCLVNKAKVAARNSKWSADAGNSRRVGFIVYRFELQ